MAAATMAGLDAHRMEEKKLEYFSSINSMAKKIMQERETIKAKHGPAWEKMTPNEQDSAIDNSMMDPQVRARYAMHRVDREEVICYPKLLIQTGQKIVHFGEEDITWQDEHSAPFSWETKSQLEFSLLPGGPGPCVSSSQADAKPVKATQSGQLSKSTPSAKVPSSEQPISGRTRPEEESSFWKLSAERSRLEGEQDDFQSLTPSQIKSLEKGEKPLPSYLRQDSSVPTATAVTKETEAAEPRPPGPSRSSKQRAPKAPAAAPPPVPVAAATPPPPPISITPVPAPSPVPPVLPVAGWERSQSTLPSVSNAVDEMFSSSLLAPRSPSLVCPRPGAAPRPGDDSGSAPGPAFSQFNTSSNILKTGFDFLDNW